MKQNAPLVVITGPTASGKTALAIRLAKEFNGEIVSADSRAIYKGLDIGTAKPTPREQREIRHWGIDLVHPNQAFSAADFQAYATKAITNIRSRGRMPILVGGTGLYVDSIIYEYIFPDTNNRMKEKLELMDLPALYEYCAKHNIQLPENYKNKRYVINTILRIDSQPKRRPSIVENTIVVGITTEKDILKDRIAGRAEEIATHDTIVEAVAVASKYGWDNQAMTGNIYPLIRLYLEGSLTLADVKAKFCVLDWRLAKRQLTWLKRNKDIWWGNSEQVYTYVARQLAKMNNS